jgi:hypothetical protein
VTLQYGVRVFEVLLILLALVLLKRRQLKLKNDGEVKSQPIGPDKLERTKELRSQLIILISGLTAMVLTIAFLLINLQTGFFLRFQLEVAILFSSMAIFEHVYAWRNFRLKMLGKVFGLCMLIVTVLFSFCPIFGINLNPQAAQVISLLALLLYLPMCLSDRLNRARLGLK